MYVLYFTKTLKYNFTEKEDINFALPVFMVVLMLDQFLKPLARIYCCI